MIEVEVAAELRQALSPVAFARERLRFQPDPWQARVLEAPKKRLLLNCSRQAGKTSVTAVAALHTAIYQPRSLTLVFSKSQRQSQELVGKIAHHLATMDRPPAMEGDAKKELVFRNGSRIVSLPGDGSTTRGFSAPDLIVEDEAAFVLDELYEAILPMLARSDGRLWLLSTPNGRRGHFYTAWSSLSDRWHRERVTAHDVPHIKPDYLDDMREELGPHRFRQEFECEFVEANQQFFSDAAIERAFGRDVPLLPLVFAA